MKPLAAIPMNDPQGVLFPHLRAQTPLLQATFERVFVSVPAATRLAHPEHMSWLSGEPFYEVLWHQDTPSVGDDFLALFDVAAATGRSEQVVHLCFIDRVAYALTHHRESFRRDLERVAADNTPLIFSRSEHAWETHPRNYRRAEALVTIAGELLFGRRLDFAWCHLALTCERLAQLLPRIERRDMALFAEFVLEVHEDVRMRPVDWLAWEDPFIFGRSAAELRAEREQSEAENRKRLGYVIPMLQLLYERTLTD